MTCNVLLFIAFGMGAMAVTSPTLAQEEPRSPTEAERVTPESFCRAESDRVFFDIARQSGGVNRFYHFRELAPLDRQTAIRLNKDTLYSFALVDVSEGATLTIPEVPGGRYASAYLLDNDHYAAGVVFAPGEHELPRDTDYLVIGLRIQLFDPDDPAEVAVVNALQDRFAIEAIGTEPFPRPAWDQASLDDLRRGYEAEFQKFAKYPPDWQGPRGTLNEQTRQLACAGAWGLLPEEEAVYINYSGGQSPDRCHKATYTVPENQAFWSITVYGSDGYIKHDDNIINTANATMDQDGTFTAHFGSEQVCGDVVNRVDVAEGWNFLMRVYRPGPSVLDGTYKLPDVVPAT